ncbi:MAG TPA: RNA 2',3'-cyclic phosphodiesterase [Candidatus Babeliaceae bacterium]|nr:RNA 2',3'-cyclic phosphodiesterase [Candidatus Babeliaceae bacterium]
MVRLFFATDVPQTVIFRAQNIQQDFSKDIGRISWVKPEKLHITLAFLGNQPRERVPLFCETLQKLLRERAQIKCRVTSLQAMAKFALSLEVISQELASLAYDIRKELDFIEVSPEFKAHCTLAYLKKPLIRELLQKQVQDINEKYKPFDCIINTFALKLSFAEKYIDLCSIKL